MLQVVGSPISALPLVLADVAEHHISPTSGMMKGLFALLLAAMILCLAFEEKIHAKKSVIVGVFSVVCLLVGGIAGLLPFEEMILKIGTDKIELPIYIPAIDWGVIAIILGSSLFVDITSKSGLFTWIAIKLTKASKGDPLYLLIFYGIMTVVFSAVLNNVTAMIIVGSLSAVSLNRLGRDDNLLGFLLIEGLLTNVGGLLTLISSVPNIIVGNTAGIKFVTFFLKASPYVIVTTAATIWMGAMLFRIKRLRSAEEKAEAQRLVSGFDENDGIDSTFGFWFGSVMLIAFIFFIAIASVEGWFLHELGMGFVAVSFAVIMLTRYKAVADRFYQALDWDLLAFFVGLFIVINVIEHAGVLALIGKALIPIMKLGETGGPAAMLVASAAASSVTDNIPLAAMLAKIMGGMPEIAENGNSPYWWSVIFGANLGGNITPIGSASTLVAVTIIYRHKLHLPFAAFVKAALPFAAMQLILGVAYVLVFLR